MLKFLSIAGLLLGSGFIGYLVLLIWKAKEDGKAVEERVKLTSEPIARRDEHARTMLAMRTSSLAKGEELNKLEHTFNSGAGDSYFSRGESAVFALSSQKPQGQYENDVEASVNRVVEGKSDTVSPPGSSPEGGKDTSIGSLQKIVTSEAQIQEVAEVIAVICACRTAGKAIPKKTADLLARIHHEVVWQNEADREKFLRMYAQRYKMIEGLGPQTPKGFVWPAINKGWMEEGESDYFVPEYSENALRVRFLRACDDRVYYRGNRYMSAANFAIELGFFLHFKIAIDMANGVDTSFNDTVNRVISVVGSTASGAAAGATGGPYGMAVGAVVGLLKGLGKEIFEGAKIALEKQGKEDDIYAKILQDIDQVSQMIKDRPIVLPVYETAGPFTTKQPGQEVPNRISAYFQRATHGWTQKPQGVYPGVIPWVYGQYESFEATLDFGDKPKRDWWTKHPAFSN
jgi:hypothetical protein